MSKKKSKKVFQVPIQEIPEWNRQLAFDGLIVAEVWSPIYGPCEAIKPFIGPLMQKLEYDNTVQWPVVNIAKLEAEAIAEKKKGTKVHVISKYFGLNLPLPVFVFIRNKTILAEVFEANTPLLQRVVEKFYKPAPEGGYQPMEIQGFGPAMFGASLDEHVVAEPEPEAAAQSSENSEEAAVEQPADGVATETTEQSEQVEQSSEPVVESSDAVEQPAVAAEVSEPKAEVSESTSVAAQ